MTLAIEPKRIKKFRLEIAKTIPKFPNNHQTLNILEAKSLGSLLIDYINWAYRFIPPRPRNVTIEPTLTTDARWKNLASDTKALLEKARQGENLNAHLSLRAHRDGYTPATSIASPKTDKWEDKDFLLNVMGYHHLHLSHVIDPKGHSVRTDVVLFAQITRTEFKAIAFFDHSVFEQISNPTTPMTQERSRLWNIYDKRNSLGREPGKVYISNPIATSGHSLRQTQLAGNYSELIYSIDEKLDDLVTRSEFFNVLPYETIKAMKLNWHIKFLDLGLIDKITSNFYILKHGPI